MEQFFTLATRCSVLTGTKPSKRLLFLENDIMTKLSRRRFLSLISAMSVAGCGGGNGTTTLIGNSGQPTPAGDPPQTTLPSQTPHTDPPPQPPVDETPKPPAANVIQRENAKTEADGVTASWYIKDEDYAENGEIEGYASATSVARGQSIKLYVNTSEPSYTLCVYRIGWYGGKGGRMVAGPITRSGIRQPAASFDPATRMAECNWTSPYTLAIPNNRNDATDWASGIYLVKLTALVSGKQSYIIFTVRDDERTSALLFQSSVTTYAAYNNWGGYDFYNIDSVGGKPAYKLSFNRPYRNPQRPHAGKGAGDFLSWELLMVRFAEREGYDLCYCTNIDVDTSTVGLTKYRAFLSVGHDEYWTRNMRDALDGARDAGVHLGFFGANAGYWQIRLEADANGTPNRTVVCYKYDAPSADPLYNSKPLDATCLWRDQIPGRPQRSESALIGVMYDYNSVDLDMVMSDCSSWICKDAGLHNGAILKGMLGYEVDRVDTAMSPLNIQVLASSPYEVCLTEECSANNAGSEAPCTDSGCATAETRYANMTFYTASSGAGVFATGSMQWNWGLDNFGPWGDRVNPAVQKMTANVLDRFSQA